MALVDINWSPSKKELRSFGWSAVIGMAIIGCVFYFAFDNHTAGVVFWVVGGVLGIPGLTGTAIGVPGYRLWMGIAFVMGNIMGRLLLGGVYYLIFTPIALTRRLFGSDKLQLKRKERDSYWVEVVESTAEDRWERQF